MFSGEVILDKEAHDVSSILPMEEERPTSNLAAETTALVPRSRTATSFGSLARHVAGMKFWSVDLCIWRPARRRHHITQHGRMNRKHQKGRFRLLVQQSMILAGQFCIIGNQKSTYKFKPGVRS
jgi:hypothetical protein